MDTENIQPAINSVSNTPMAEEISDVDLTSQLVTDDADTPLTVDPNDVKMKPGVSSKADGVKQQVAVAWHPDEDTPNHLLAKKKPSRRAFESPSLQQRASLQMGAGANAMWSQAVQGAKDHQMGKSLSQRQMIEQQKQQLGDSKVAKKRIEQWKEFSVQNALSAEETGSTWRQIKDVLQDTSQLHEIDRTLPQNTKQGFETFVLGQTRIYTAANLSLELNAYLHKVCDAREKYVPLVCGVKKNVRVVALAAKAANEQFYMSICIKPTTAGPISKVLGSTSIAFYGEEREKLTEIDFFLYASQEEANAAMSPFGKSRKGSLGDDEEEEDAEEDGEDDSPFPSYYRDSKTPAPLSLKTPTQIASYLPDEDVERVMRHVYTTDSEGAPDSSAKLFPEVLSSPLSAVPLNDMPVVASNFSPPSALAPLSVVTNTWFVDDSEVTGSASGTNFVDYGITTDAIVPVDVLKVQETNSSDRLFVCATESESILIDQNLKFSRSASKCVVEHNRAYEWIEGVYLEGWLYKWPAKYSGFGKPQKRFFILKDNLLCYYDNKPLKEQDYQRVKILNISEDTQIEKVANMFQNCLKISSANGGESIYIKVKEGTRKERAWIQAIKQSMKLQSAKRLSLMSTIKTLWHVDFSRAGKCDIVSVDATMLRDDFVKTSLFHCSSEMAGRLMDLDDEDDEVSIMSGSRSDIGSHNNPRADEWNMLANPKSYYTVDIVTNEVEKLQLEVLLTNEMPFHDSTLKCIKIYGDKLLLGGSDGFVGIGMVGKSTELSLSFLPQTEKYRRVLYVVKCRGPNSSLLSGDDGQYSSRSKASTATTGVSPHDSSSEVRFFAYTDQSDIFVAADNQRLLSFWHLNKEHSAEELVMSPTSKRKPGFYYDCKPELQSVFNLASLDRDDESGGSFFADEQITALHFLPENSYLIVCTTMRLLLLEVTYASNYRGSRSNGKGTREQDIKFGVVGYVQLDTVQTSRQRALFSLNVVDPSQSNLPVRSPATLSDVSSGSAYNLQGLSEKGVHKVQSASKLKQLEKRLSHKSLSLLEKRIVHWRFMSKANGDSSAGCSASRVEWTEQQFAHFVQKIKPVPF